MKCPACRDLNNHVIDSRLSKEGDVIRRRRECEQCGRRFTTYERVEEYLPSIVKKDGRREPFDRQKVLAGLTKACEKRPVSTEAIERTADDIERSLQERGEKEVPSSVVGEAIMRMLHDLDTVAYVRFASVYRSFQDIDEFMQELEDLLKERRGGTKGDGPGNGKASLAALRTAARASARATAKAEATATAKPTAKTAVKTAGAGAKSGGGARAKKRGTDRRGGARPA